MDARTPVFFEYWVVGAVLGLPPVQLLTETDRYAGSVTLFARMRAHLEVTNFRPIYGCPTSTIDLQLNCSSHRQRERTRH